MKLAGYVLLACVVLAVLKALAAVLLLALGTTLLVGLIHRPAETVRAVITILAMVVFVARPIEFAVAVCLSAALLNVIYVIETHRT